MPALSVGTGAESGAGCHIYLGIVIGVSNSLTIRGQGDNLPLSLDIGEIMKFVKIFCTYIRLMSELSPAPVEKSKIIKTEKHKPAAQAAGVDTSQCNSTTR
jgi:hypothetical protein